MYDYEANKEKLCDSSGRRLTSGLFHELQRDTTGAAPVFYLKDWKKIYVDIADPTEYRAAMELIGDWDHWKQLRANPVVARHFDEWKSEVEIKLRSAAIKEMVKTSRTDKGAAAARWLAEAGFVQEKRSRKEKESTQEQTFDRVREDAGRLGIKVVK